MAQFNCAKEFADFICAKYGRSRLIMMNKRAGRDRLRMLVGEIELGTRYKYLLDVQYNATCYALNSALLTGRTNLYADNAVCSMNIRKLCELVYELAQTDEGRTGSYGSYLNLKYTPLSVLNRTPLKID